MSDPHDHDSTAPQEPAGGDEVIDLTPESTPEPGLVSGRSASVRFDRRGSSAHTNNRARMDAANQSLADALRITYVLLQFGMVVLAVLFLASGVQRVNEGERGISVRFGKTTEVNIEPGPAFTMPYPIGELIRVGAGAVEISMGSDFMSSRPGAMSEDDLLNADFGSFNSSLRLKPVEDSMVITADQNIAHAQFRVIYHRANPLEYVQHIRSQDEATVVSLVVRRAVVHTMAETTIDDLLKASAEGIGERVREHAQRSLDELDSGINIDRVLLVRKTPPLFLSDRFASVQSAAQNAGKQREDALLQREQMLSSIAGRASGVLIEMINEYERLTELGDTESAETLLAQIDAVLMGEESGWGDEPTLGLISGEVSEILSTAQARASSRVSRAIADLEQFRAKQAQFEANPALMVARDWSSAMADFLSKDFVLSMYLPEGSEAELIINPDQDWEEEREMERRRREAAEQQQRRREEAMQDFFRTQRGIQAEDME